MNRSHADDAEDTSSAGDGVAMPAVTDALSASQLDTLKDLFTVFDQQNLGHMPVTELRVALRMAGVETNRDEAHGLIAMFCADREAGFTLDEFLSVVNEKIRDRPADYRDNFLATVFDAIDSEEASWTTFSCPSGPTWSEPPSGRAPACSRLLRRLGATSTRRPTTCGFLRWKTTSRSPAASSGSWRI
jgi:Ca2+-binding EF-hand superfamily protein